MRYRLLLHLWVFFIGTFVLSCTGSSTPFLKEVPRISKEELKLMLGKPDVMIIDVRHPDDWKPVIKGGIQDVAGK